MLYEKYEPKALKEFIGSSRQASEILGWLKDVKKPLLIAGPTGSGKTLLIRLIAKQMNYEIVESNNLDEMLMASKERSIFYKGKLMVLEFNQLRNARGASEAVKTAKPLIIVANDIYDRRLAGIRRMCRVVKLERPSSTDIMNFLKRVCRAEKINYTDEKLLTIAKNCSGDIRAALIDLEAGDYEQPNRDKEENIYEVLDGLSASDLGASRKILSKTNMEQVFLWAEENVVNEHRNIEGIALAYESLAKADLFRARIVKRQAWTLQKYYGDFLSASFSGTRKSAFTFYKPPFFMRKQKNLDPVLEKIAMKLHISKKEARSCIGLIKKIYKKNKETAKEFGFLQEDIDSIKLVKI